MNEYPHQSLTTSQMITIIRYGLPKTSHPQKVIVAGAGMAGLVAASLLKDAGHDVTILEASNRVGGRVYTLRAPFTKGHYLNAGAMRIPHIHPLTWEYILDHSPCVNAWDSWVIPSTDRKLTKLTPWAPRLNSLSCYVTG
ncbi:monoamine oxidase [Thermoflavimicrobium dichotomicum]|uniref:Monoamine oxidase n=1 Tax=Thermoflavimicrobium dichotomicum TaxID=46223 RepID=A0A1I3P363_9BACL|nr:monoamine oxidase [Thermoflavimicrobium dichotomicum]